VTKDCCEFNCRAKVPDTDGSGTRRCVAKGVKIGKPCLGYTASCNDAKRRDFCVNLHYRGWKSIASVVLSALAAFVLVGGLLSACGSKQESTPQPAAEPVTISHKFGETKVPANPQRVVTVGWTDQ